MKHRVIFFLFISLFLVPQAILAAGPATRTLEIIYPQIPGVDTPKYVSSGLPEYVNYIFRFAVILIGILIFGVLIYSGVNYLFSFGNPAKLSDATQGMTAAGLGGLILLGAYIIFNTINPQLLILTPSELGMLKAYIIPGVYICNYNVDEREDWKKDGVTIEIVMKEYTEGELEDRKIAAERLKNAMGKAGDRDNCFLANYSGILTNFRPKDNFTLFVIPSEKYIPNTSPAQYEWKYEHGIIFHENDKFGDRCQVFPEVSGDTVYHQVNKNNYHPTLDFKAGSVTVFRKPSFEPASDLKGVTLYEGPVFNEIGKPKEGEPETCGNGDCDSDKGEDFINCPQDCEKPTIFREIFFSFFSPFFALAEIDLNLIVSPSLKPSADILIVTADNLKNIKDAKGKRNLYQNTRSIKIDQKDSYFTVLFGNGGKKCEVRTGDDVNLLDDPIGRCGTGCETIILGRFIRYLGMCKPCLESLYVIKGHVL